MKNHFQEAHLSAYERRLEALGALLDREIHTILLHLAHEMPLVPAAKTKPLVHPMLSKAAADPLSGPRRANARDLLELYSARLRKKVLTTGVETPADLLTYAQMLEQALHLSLIHI